MIELNVTDPGDCDDMRTLDPCELPPKGDLR